MSWHLPSNATGCTWLESRLLQGIVERPHCLGLVNHVDRAPQSPGHACTLMKQCKHNRADCCKNSTQPWDGGSTWAGTDAHLEAASICKVMCSGLGGASRCMTCKP